MKSKLLRQLKRLDNTLKRDSWSNYQLFLDKLLRAQNYGWAVTLHGYLRGGDFLSLVRFADSLVEQTFSTAAEHFAANQTAALIRKYPFPASINFDSRGEAVRKFWRYEHYCKRTNQRFRALYKRNPYNESLVRASRWIGYVLGRIDLSDIYGLCDWGPGASVGVHGVLTNSARKLLADNWTVSPGALLYARSAMITDQHILELLNGDDYTKPVCVDESIFYDRFIKRARICNYNKIAFVPKTVLVQRTIAVEPLLNGFVQKGVDQFMRKKLKRVGINLSDQTRNQELARKGSLSDDSDPYVTIDLSSASDSVSIELVRHLLPPDWFDFLNSLRSRRFLLDGKEFTYQKFASMGNGFCFPLETLIFASLCVSVYDKHSLKHDFSVYGDDIIVRQSTAADLLNLLKICGFRANSKKTFLQGPFRESCGADWYEGRDVRPISLDYAFDSLENIFKFCNLVRSKNNSAMFFFEHLEFLEALIPHELRLCRPYRGNVDSALEVPFDVFMASPYSRWDSDVQSWSWLELMKSGKPDKPVSQLQGYHVALMKAALKGSPSRSPFTERRNTRTKVRRNAYSGASSCWLPGAGRL